MVGGWRSYNNIRKMDDKMLSKLQNLRKQFEAGCMDVETYAKLGDMVRAGKL